MHTDIPRVIKAAGDRTCELERALEQKSALLHEVDHRVKNNLQLISSLLLLQARRATDPEVRRALKSAQSRVNAVAVVHRRLFQGEDPDRFDVATFIRDLADDAIAGSGRLDIQARLHVEPADLPTAQAAPLALLLGELIRNAILHGFPDGRPGVIELSAAQEGDRLRIEIADNGVGLGVAGVQPGFGRTIVRLLSEQLHAVCETMDANPGVRTVIRLPTNGPTRVQA